MEGISREKIHPVLSPEYRQEVEHPEKIAQRAAHNIWGGWELHRLDIVRAGTASRPELEQFHRARLRDVWENLFSHDHQAALKLTKEIAADQEMIQGLAEYLRNSGQEIVEPPTDRAIWEALSGQPALCRSLPDSLAERLTRRHVEYVNARQEAFEQRELPAIMAETDRRMRLAIARGTIPVTEEQWERFRSVTPIRLLDPLFEYEDRGGSYRSHIVFLSSEADVENKVSILVHESLHALSGRTVVQVTETDEEFGDDTSFDHRRLGLHFSSDIWAGRQEKFRWLNEAVTEDLTVEISGGEDHGVYQHERRLLDQLSGALGPGGRRRFREAYFEDYDPQLNNEERIPFYRKLVRTVGAELGQDFLVNLDTFIHWQRTGDGQRMHWMEGVEIAAGQWERRGEKFPEYVGNWVEQHHRRFRGVSNWIVEELYKEDPGLLERVNFYELEQLYPKLWRDRIRNKIPHPSQYELAVYRDLVYERLVRDIRKQKRKAGDESTAN